MSLFLTLNKKFFKKVYTPFFGPASKAKATLRRRFTYYHQVPRNSWKVPGNFILCSTVSVVDFKQVNAHRVEACHTFHISTICKKTSNDSHMLNQECNFIFREKDEGKIFTPGLILYDFGMTPNLGSYWSQYLINNVHIIKISTKF